MTKQDSDVISFTYDANQHLPVDIVGWLRQLRVRILDKVKEEEELNKTHMLVPTWLMSKQAFEKLPDKPNWIDMLNAGAIPIGYTWEKKEDYQDDKTRVSAKTSGTAR